MSSKDDKADLSNLKSRLGLNKKEKKDQKGDSAGSPGSSGKDKPDSGGASGASADTKSGGGVDDRLAALKKSTLGEEEDAGDPSDAATAGETGRSSSASSPAGGATSQPATGATGASTASGSSGGAGAQQPAGAGTPMQGPPPGAKGPPPTAMQPAGGGQSKERSTTADDETSADSDEVDFEDLDDIDLGEIGIDDDSILSAPIIGLLLVLLVVGLIFGFLAAESMQSREIEQARINDAANLQEEVEPRFDDFERAREIIEELDPTDVDFEAAEQLAELEFVVDGRMLPGNRILLGGRVIGPLNRYMGESNVLQQLVQEHQYLTSQADREELEAYMEEIDELDDDEQIAAVFDMMTLRSHMADVAREEAEPGDYIPPRGRLLRIPEDFEELEPDEDGMVEVEVVASGVSDQIDIQAIVPIVDTDFIDVDTGNALQRYGERVEQLQRYVDELDGTVSALREEVDRVASAEPPPLFTLTSSEDPADEFGPADEAPEPDEVLDEADDATEDESS